MKSRVDLPVERQHFQRDAEHEDQHDAPEIFWNSQRQPIEQVECSTQGRVSPMKRQHPTGHPQDNAQQQTTPYQLQGNRQGVKDVTGYAVVKLKGLPQIASAGIPDPQPELHKYGSIKPQRLPHLSA